MTGISHIFIIRIDFLLLLKIIGWKSLLRITCENKHTLQPNVIPQKWCKNTTLCSDGSRARGIKLENVYIKLWALSISDFIIIFLFFALLFVLPYGISVDTEPISLYYFYYCIMALKTSRIRDRVRVNEWRSAPTHALPYTYTTNHIRCAKNDCQTGSYWQSPMLALLFLFLWFCP